MSFCLDDMPSDDRPHRRGMHEIEVFRLRSELLSREDKTFMQMIFDNGGTFDQIARLTGQNPSTISRRFHTLLQKLFARELVAFLRRRQDMDQTQIGIVQDYFLRALPQKTIARKFSVSLYYVRATLGVVRSIVYDKGAVSIRRNRKSMISCTPRKGASDAHPER
jgi:hypothetical protein